MSLLLFFFFCLYMLSRFTNLLFGCGLFFFLMKGCENVKETLSRRLCDGVRAEGNTDRRKRGKKE